MRIFYSTFLFIVLCFGTIFVAGFVSDPEYRDSKSTLFDDKIENVWSVMTDVEGYIDNKKNIQRIEVTDKYFNTINSWDEFYPRGEVYSFELVTKDSPNLFVLNISNKNREIDRTLEYYLSQNGTNTKLTITEISNSNHLFWRGVETLLGRNNFIERELKWIRVGLFEELIDNV